ncbi:MAG: SDR family oxidoreductase [Acidimicrobiales bacterium]|nr:SDR family oxidoreductase [Acidimicrobiales bacterium]
MTALVTGAGGALGGAIAARLAADGHPVAVVDIDAAGAEATASRIRSRGGAAVAFPCDLRDADRIAATFVAAQHDLGPLAVLVNNAAVFPSGPFVDVTVEEHDETIAVNQRAYFLCAQHAARSMIAAGEGGSIVNVASITWHGYWAHMSPYVAAKGAIIAMTRALARELGPREIRVNAVAPGAFPTRAERIQHPDLGAYERHVLDSQALKRRGTFDELAAVVSFLAGAEASFVTGQTLNVDGGWVMT